MNWILKHFEELPSQDLYEILRLRNAVFIVEQDCPYEDIDGRDQYGYHLYAKDEQGKICAYLRILEKGQTFPEVSIGRVMVRKETRGSGTANKMVQKAIDFILNDLQEQTIRIEAQAYLLNFYRSFGFLPCSEPYLEDGIPHVEMVYEKK